MKRLAPSILATISWVALSTGQANPVLADSDPPHATRVALSDDQLGEQRGGFLVADGIKLDFAASVKTFVDGQLALETNLAWTPTGPVTTQTLGDNTSPVTGAALSSAATLTAAGLPSGLSLPAGGATALIQQVAGASLANMVFTTASNQNILQQIDVNVTLPGFDVTQQGMALSLLGMRLAADGSLATIGALH